jgi:quercetin dioxygenase-like cupin family protein
MRVAIAFTVVLALGIGSAAAQQPGGAQEEGIVRAGSRPAMPGPAATFTGSVTVRPVVDPMPPGRTSLGIVTFQPGARSHWHTHPAGQMIHVTEGCGWTQRTGGPVVRICAGDTAFVPAGMRHWHGAAADTAMTQLAVTETVDGRNVEWQEPVTAEQYRLAPGNPR